MHISAGNTSISRQNRTKTRKTDTLCVFMREIPLFRGKIEPKLEKAMQVSNKHAQVSNKHAYLDYI